MTNTRITDPEILELNYPALLKKFGIRDNSGGNGKWRGGNGVIREIEFLEPVELTLLSQHRKVAPFGLEGGEEGSTGNQYIVRKGKKEIIEGINESKLNRGDKIIIETPGGGGWGVTD